ncbi:hypothetical protein NDU88_001729 [Pleurodeles waltl]|uniref:Fibronectin type-III domain-containing protein n=2 Tax=Pleurodeles waltl TaxID=8319 RepID=A0AAV7TIN1_PLEWA|nr:hypothetical protein NDU88_001729 [Pleurodeles waltl]
MSVSAGGVACAGLCLLQMIAGQLLDPPQNVTFYTKNFTVVVKWLPGDGYPADVRYTVEYGQGLPPSWKPIPKCQHISNGECDVTCVEDSYSRYKARVKASVGTQESPWKESETNFSYLSDVEMGPPQLHVNVSEKHMIIHAIVRPQSCKMLTWLGIKYEWTRWEIGKEFKKSDPQLIFKPGNISIAGLHGNYCIVARTIFNHIEEKRSPFSEPLCLQLNQENTDRRSPLVVSAFFLVVVALVICLIMAFITLPKAKLPASLDFPLSKWPLKQYICDPNDLLLKLSQISTCDPPVRNVDNGYYASLDDHEETSSSCRGYSENRQFPNLGAPIEDPNETKKYPYRKLPSTRSNDAESSDSVQVLGASGLLFVENTNEKEPSDVESEENSLCELCGERMLSPNALKMKERNLILASSEQTSFPCFCQIPLSAVLAPGTLRVATLSESNLTLISNRDIWTSKPCSAINHSQDICLQSQTPYLTSSPQLEEDQHMCFLVTMDTHSGNLLDNCENDDWDELLAEAESADESAPFDRPIEPCLRESSSCDNIPGQMWKMGKSQSAYMSRMC